MLGWTRRGLQAGEARLARWSPLQAARPTGQPMTPGTTRPVGRSGRDWRPQPAGSICSDRSTHGWRWAITGTVCMSRMSALD